MTAPLTFFNCDMQAATMHHLAGMQVMAYSNQAPDKSPGMNEDAMGIFPLGPRQAVMALADGAGGQRGGAQASAMAISCLQEALQGSDTDTRAAILNALDSANTRICAQGTGAATTIIVLEWLDGRVRAYHAGDSVILVTGQRGRLRMQTLPHSPVGYAVESGMLDEREAMHHEERHLVSNMLGMPELRLEMGAEIKLAVHDTVVMASDGLFDNVHLHEVIEIVRCGPLQAAAQRLISLANERMLGARDGQPSKADDLSFILLRRG
ncbi:PP2C family protein-serine/threonine phosphatase [Sulfuriflexus sp.]|uniref:PP2C family protein-serine/threonine phosphatase n=1 Tax=Sulfuriflexus sp. TaxID=2015443 RepID=UPI0028CCF242|nr:protein phosphatase 2C domain-containing protein [Sulfuriflexus sp.]MDT8404599.1 protein phosphatase 2C domain-containing protein [Sulfuriflexus sp.]